MGYLVKLLRRYTPPPKMRDTGTGEYKELSFDDVQFDDVPEWAKTFSGLEIKLMVNKPKKSKTMLRASAKPRSKKKKK